MKKRRPIVILLAVVCVVAAAFGGLAASIYAYAGNVVSDPLYMRRAMLIAQDLGMDAHPSPTPTFRYQSARSQVEFLARETYYYFTYWVRRPFLARF